MQPESKVLLRSTVLSSTSRPIRSPRSRAVYLEDTGHMSGVDPLLALDRAARAGRLRPGDLVLLLAAGTGYTWAAACLRW